MPRAIPLTRIIRHLPSLLTLVLPIYSQTGFALFFDGSGHYGLRGETQTAPGNVKDRGMYEAINQSFRLSAEARTDDKASFFMEMRLFDKMKDSSLGDEVQPSTCAEGKDEKCKGSYQNTSAPGYKPYSPYVTQAFMRYAFDYCLMEAGRRGRDWGLGLLLDSGKRPFSQQQSVFDGVSCDINLQKFQNLGFSFGFDKLAETGTYVHSGSDRVINFGRTNPSDDIDQYFFTINYDDRNSPSESGKQIAIYAANIKSPSVKDGGSGSDLTFLDLYTAFYLPTLTFRNEFVFRLGKTADPNATRLGGASENKGDPAANRMQSIGFAGGLEWALSGTLLQTEASLINPPEGKRHIFLLDYAYAPGDDDGYYVDESGSALAGKQKRDQNALAIAFNPNYKPALILFNGHSEIDDLRVDGVFDPSAFMNAQMYSLGYRYEDSGFGKFETRLFYATLNSEIPEDIKTYYAASETKPVGYYGSDLGVEADFKYWTTVNKTVDLGGAAGVLFPGKAWQIKDDQPAVYNMIFQAFMTYNF